MGSVLVASLGTPSRNLPPSVSSVCWTASFHFHPPQFNTQPKTTVTEMKSHSALLALALVVTAAVTQQQAVAVDAATTNSTTAALCADTTRVTLGSCGSGKCGEDQPCAQYPSGSTVVCSDAAGAKCVEQDATCTYQCLDNAYAPAAMKWTLFVKDPKSVDVYASAPIEKISTGVFSSDMHNM